jgi:hypothetical protein
LGDFVIGWLFVFAGIFLLLLYSSLQMGVFDSPCVFITHLEVSVFFFPHFCNVATLASGPQTDSVRVRINWRHAPPQKGSKFGELFLRKMRILATNLRQCCHLAFFLPKKTD